MGLFFDILWNIGYYSFWIILLSGVGWCLFRLIDSTFLPVQTGKALVVRSVHLPAYNKPTDFIPHITMGVPTPSITHIPESFHLDVIMNGKKYSMAVSRDIFTASKEGNTVSIEPTVGRYSQNVYPIRVVT